MKRTFLAALVVALAPATAYAYVGPGAGLSLLGALWALIAAIGIAIAFVVAWPIRKMMRKKKAARPQVQQRRQTDRPAAADRAEPAGAQRTGDV